MDNPNTTDDIVDNHKMMHKDKQAACQFASP
jgi:hypothetical protein